MEINNIFIGQVYKIDHVSNDDVVTSHSEYQTILCQGENEYFDIRSETNIPDFSAINCPTEDDLFVDSTDLIPYNHFSFSWSEEDSKTLEELQNNLKNLNRFQKKHRL